MISIEQQCHIAAVHACCGAKVAVGQCVYQGVVFGVLNVSCVPLLFGCIGERIAGHSNGSDIFADAIEEQFQHFHAVYLLVRS